MPIDPSPYERQEIPKQPDIRPQKAQKSSRAPAPASTPSPPISKTIPQVPITITIPKGTDLSNIYVRLQGLAPEATSPYYFVKFDSSGKPVGFEPETTANSYTCSYPLSMFKSSGNTITLNIPGITSGQMFFSEGNPIPTDPTINPGSPENTFTPWSEVEVTNTAAGVWTDITAVDSFGSPSVYMTMDAKNQKPQHSGYDNYPETLIDNYKAELAKLCGGTNTAAYKLWIQTIYTYPGTSNQRILAAKVIRQQMTTVFTSYLNNGFLKQFDSPGMYLDTRYGTAQCILKNGVFTFTYVTGSPPHTPFTIPLSETMANNLEPWFSGGGMTNPSPEQQDAMKMLSGLLMSGIAPGKTGNSETNPLNSAYFHTEFAAGNCYKAEYQGMPMWDVYEHAMHLAGWTAYAYDYDDLFGKSGTLSTSHTNDPSFDFSLFFKPLPPNNNTLQSALTNAQNWLNGPPPLTSQVKNLANDLIKQIKQEIGISGDTIKTLQAWLFTNFTSATQDMYMQYPGIIQTEAGKFMSIIMGNATWATPPTPMDSIYGSAYSDLQGITTTPGKNAFNALLAEMRTLGCAGTLAALQAWVTNTFKTNDIYQTYPGITKAVATEYYGIVQMIPPPH